MSRTATLSTLSELPNSLETRDIADQGFSEKPARGHSTVSLGGFSDQSTLGKQSDLEGGLSILQAEGSKATHLTKSAS